jgi:hypothetical protein
MLPRAGHDVSGRIVQVGRIEVGRLVQLGRLLRLWIVPRVPRGLEPRELPELHQLGQPFAVFALPAVGMPLAGAGAIGRLVGQMHGIALDRGEVAIELLDLEADGPEAEVRRDEVDQVGIGLLADGDGDGTPAFGIGRRMLQNADAPLRFRPRLPRGLDGGGRFDETGRCLPPIG